MRESSQRIVLAPPCYSRPRSGDDGVQVVPAARRVVLDTVPSERCHGASRRELGRTRSGLVWIGSCVD